MKIYSMTATFGKLEHQTLTLEPGLNVIHAPNEWGKSTWCAFLVAMLYGIETRERSTAKALADKERYAPWSGSPMSGRIDLCWNGRDITIQRRTKGRVIFGEFTAFETASGIPVAELTAANCGQVLLGVEKSVFLRAGFLRLTDLPVTEDDALRRRLNALVTTGDESGAGDALAQKLRDLKNKVRHNKTGLLPNAMTQKAQLEGKLEELHSLQLQIIRLQQSQQAMEAESKALENHRDALAYEDAQMNLQRVRSAEEARDSARINVDGLQLQCAQLPSPEEIADTQKKLQALQQEWADLQTTPPPQSPNVPVFFTGMDATQALQQAKSDKSAYDMLCRPISPLLLILAAVSLCGAAALAFFLWQAAIPCGLIGVLLMSVYLRNKAAQKRDRQALCSRYGDAEPDSWISAAECYVNETTRYTQQVKELADRKAALEAKTDALCNGSTVADTLGQTSRQLDLHRQLEAAKQGLFHSQRYYDGLAAMVKDVPAPREPDSLTLSQTETDSRLAQLVSQLQQYHQRLGQLQGQMETLGTEQALLHQLNQLQQRISALEETYAAIEFAQQTLEQASQELQRRFAPRISLLAQSFFERLTGGRYDKLTLSQDLSLNASAEDEDTLRPTQWRSDGTVDQLYLALRLAVARELTSQAPLILDDALVRFDESRLAAAVAILKDEAQDKQVILFSCQNREQALLEQ